MSTGTVKITETPAVENYPTDGPHADILEKTLAVFQEELKSTEGWLDQGEREGAQLFSKPDPDDAYAVPTVKGECIVKNCTSDDFLAVILMSGMRKRWDTRFESGHLLQRYSRDSYEFWSVMKGMGWIVYPRDICGVQKNYRSTKPNQEITIIQVSVVDDELCPEQYGKTRATLSVSGWSIVPEGADLRVTYIVKISLNGSIPSQMVNMVAIEIPACTGRARDVYYDVGPAPYTRSVGGKEQINVVLQTEEFSDPGLGGDKGDLVYRCGFTTKEGESFEVKYNKDRMYTGGIKFEIEGTGAQASDDPAEGVVTVKCTTSGQNLFLVLGPA